jgi:sugar (pentulose or hexulose) kinase
MGSLESLNRLRSRVWLQILADVLEIQLIAPQVEEGAAYGAAILAMVAVPILI